MRETAIRAVRATDLPERHARYHPSTRPRVVRDAEAMVAELYEQAGVPLEGREAAHVAQEALGEQPYRQQAICLGEGEKALLVRLANGAEGWVPRSVILRDSEVRAGEDDGELVVEGWFAERSHWTEYDAAVSPNEARARFKLRGFLKQLKIEAEPTEAMVAELTRMFDEAERTPKRVGSTRT